MATGFSVDQTNRHAHAINVVLDIYPQIMREMIVNIFPPIGVSRQIQNEPKQLFMKQLAPEEKKMISKLNSTGYNGLDISCLYKLIRYFNLLPPPTKGWGQKPRLEDKCEGDDVERMIRNRNNIIHLPRAHLSESDGNYFFQQSIEIAQRMDSRIGSPQNGFESKIEKVQSNFVIQEQDMKVLEKCPDYQELLQDTKDAPCILLYYGNDIKIKIDKHIENENNDESSSDCVMYLNDPDFDVNSVIEILDSAKEYLCKETSAISYKHAINGSLNLHISIPEKCFVTKEVLHKAIQHFLIDIFKTASIKCTHGHTYTVVLAISTDLVSDNELTKQEDVDYLKEQLPSILKLNVKVKDSAFQNENVLYREVNRFVSGVYNTLNKYTDSLNGSSREVFMLTANECEENCTPSLKSNVDPPQLRKAQVPVIGEEDSNYFKISTLLLRIAPRAVKIKFDDEFRPEVLKETLNSNKSVIADMKNKRLINQVQWNSMFPRKGNPVSQFFDTTLMICLLGNLKDIKISDELPHQTDYSVGAYLSRINIYRRDIANLNDDTIQNEKFAACWSATEAAVVRLSGGKLKEECSNLKTKSYVCADRKSTLNNIQAGKRLVQIECAERVEKLDNNQDSIIKETQEWEEESKWFVQTKAYTFIIRHVDQRVLTVVGNKGMGKSMLLHQTALFLKVKKGYSIFSCDGPSELVSQHRANTKQVFILDDACGQFTLVQSNVDQWKQYETRIAKILESKEVIIISSCRSNMFIDKQCQSLLIFSGCRCDLNDGDYAINKQEKITIAKNYLSQLTISEVQSDLDSFDMFPLLCRLYTERAAWNAINFFHDPFSFYKEEMNGFYKEDSGIICCSLFLCVINNGCLDQTILMDESESVIWPKFKMVFAEFGLKPDLSRKSVTDSLDTLVNIYLKKRNDEFHILHDRLFDFLCYYFGERHQRLMINYADSRMIRDRTLLDTSQTSSQEFTIIIERQNESDYFQRLVKDMLSGYLDDVLYNHQIRYEDFRLKLLAHLQKLDDNDLTVTNVFSDFVIDESGKPSPLIPVDFACKYGYRELFEFFLSKTKNINAYEGNNSPLITACRKGDKYMTGLLLEKGADVNQTDALGGSPLLWSSVYGNLSIVKMLLNKGADITYIDVCSECSPLVWPCLGEFLYLYKQEHITEIDINELGFIIEHIIQTFLIVLQNGYSRGCIVANEKCVAGKPPRFVNVVQTILEIIYRGNIEVYPDVRFQNKTTNQVSPFIEIMNLFVDSGVDIDKCSIGGLTALSFACMIDINNSQSVSYLLSKGASVNKYEKEGTFPVHIAVRLGKEGLVKLLIDNGANVNLPVDGIHPIDWAISKHIIPIIDSLIEAGANINHRYKNGFTLLHCAIKCRDEKLIKSLLKGGISVHYEDRSGDTPLIIAVNLSLVNVVAILIKEGAEVDTYNSKGVSPLMLASLKGDVNIVKIMLQEKLLFTKIHTVDCLFSACRNEHLEVVVLLLEKGYDINITEPNNGNTCLLEASRDGYTSMVALLLDKAANVNASNRNWDTPLIMASKNGHTHIVRLLVAKGAYMYRSNKKGESSTTVACINNHLEVIKVLTENGCNIDCIEKKSKQTSLSVASYHGYDKIVAYLIRHGANVNTQNYIGNTPLKLAATKCHFNIVKMLVEHKANINIRNNEGSASVSAACYHDNDEIVAYLIEHGANMDTQNNKGNTPLMLAASKGYFNIVKMLVENKANVNIGNEEGFTCVSVASYHGNCDILAYLIVHGASVNTQNKKGNTALMIAASKGRLYIVEILIEHGADVNIRNDNGSTSVELASYKYNDKMLAYLIEHGARVNTQNNEGNTPLMIAATKDCLKIIKILIKHGADINIRNEEGSTCLSFASEKGLDNIVEYLLDKKASINSANNNGDSPLMLALQNDNVSTAKLLLDFGANVNMKNKEGLPPLHFARKNKHYEIEVILNKTLQKEFNRNARQLIFITFVIFITWLYFTRFNVMLYSEL